MKVATFNVNGINVRLPVLFRWLVEAKPDNDRARLDERKVSKSGTATESLCAFLANARQVGTVRRSWQGERRVPAASSYADTGLQPYSNKPQNGIKMGIHRAFRHQLPFREELTAPASHVIDMRADFALFRERLAEACCARNMTETKVCSRIGLGAKRAIHLALAGRQAIDVWRVCQIADALDVSG